MEYKVIRPFVYDKKDRGIGEIVNITNKFDIASNIKRNLIIEYTPEVNEAKPVETKKVKSKK